MAGIITDSLGRKWDPKKHPRDRKGRFIRTFHKVRLFDVGGSKPWGVGKVSSINGEDHIGVQVTALARNNPDSASHRVGERIDAKASNLESVNEKASLSGISEDNQQKKDLAAHYENLMRALSASRTNVVPDSSGKVTRGDAARSRDQDSMEQFVQALEQAGIDPQGADPEAPDGLPALQEVIDQRNEADPLPNGYKEILPETMDREFKSPKGKRKGVALIGANDEPDYFESDDDGDTWEPDEDADSIEDLFDDTDEDLLEDNEEPSTPTKRYTEDEFLEALESIFVDEESVLGDGEAQTLVPGYTIEKPEGSNTNNVVGPDGADIVKIPNNADQERLDAAAAKIYAHQEENAPEEEPEVPKATIPEATPEEPTPDPEPVEETPEPEPEPDPEAPTKEPLQRYDEDLTPTAQVLFLEEDLVMNGVIDRDDNNSDTVDELEAAGFLTKDGEGSTYRLTDDGQTAIEAVIARDALPDLDEEKAERDAAPSTDDSAEMEEGDITPEQDAILGLDSFFETRSPDQIPEELERLEEQGLVEIDRSNLTEDGDGEWVAKLTPEGQQQKNELLHRLGWTHALKPEDLTDAEIEEDLARLDASDADPNANTFTKNSNRLRRTLVTRERDKRQGGAEPAAKPDLQQRINDWADSILTRLGDIGRDPTNLKRRYPNLTDEQRDRIMQATGHLDFAATGQNPNSLINARNMLGDNIDSDEEPFPELKKMIEDGEALLNGESEPEDETAPSADDLNAPARDILDRLDDGDSVTYLIGKEDGTPSSPEDKETHSGVENLEEQGLVETSTKPNDSRTNTVEVSLSERGRKHARDLLNPPSNEDDTVPVDGPAIDSENETDNYIETKLEEIGLTPEEVKENYPNLTNTQATNVADAADSLHDAVSTDQFIYDTLQGARDLLGDDIDRDEEPFITLKRLIETGEALYGPSDEENNQTRLDEIDEELDQIAIDRREADESELDVLFERERSLIRERNEIRDAQPEPDLSPEAEEAEKAYTEAEDDEGRKAAAPGLVRALVLLRDKRGRLINEKGRVLKKGEDPVIVKEVWETPERQLERYFELDSSIVAAKWTSLPEEFPLIDLIGLTSVEDSNTNPRDTRLNPYMRDSKGWYRYFQRGFHNGTKMRKGDTVAFKFKQTIGEEGTSRDREGLWVGKVIGFFGNNGVGSEKGGKIKIRYTDATGKSRVAEIDYDNVFHADGIDTTISQNKDPVIKAPSGLTFPEELGHFLDAWIGADNQKRFSRLNGREKLTFSNGYYLTAREGGEPLLLTLHAPDGRVVNEFIDVRGYQTNTVARKISQTERDQSKAQGHPIHNFEDKEGFIAGMQEIMAKDIQNPAPDRRSESEPSTPEVPEEPATPTPDIPEPGDPVPDIPEPAADEDGPTQQELDENARILEDIENLTSDSDQEHVDNLIADLVLIEDRTKQSVDPYLDKIAEKTGQDRGWVQDQYESRYGNSPPPRRLAPAVTPDTQGERRDLDSFLPDTSDMTQPPLPIFQGDYNNPADKDAYLDSPEFKAYQEWELKNTALQWRRRAEANENVFAAGPTLPVGNVDFATRGANKIGQPGYTDNCFNCVTAWVMRMKGYDVVAKPNGTGVGQATAETVDRWWWGVGRERIKKRDARGGQSKAAFDKKIRRELSEEHGPGAYGLISYSKGRVTFDSIGRPTISGHVFIWYVDPEGNTHLYEPQWGTEHVGASVWDGTSTKYPLRIARLDDLPLPTGEGVVSNVPATGPAGGGGVV